MRHHKKLSISLILIFLLNMFLILFGIYFMNQNVNDQKQEFYNDFTSRLFVSNVTQGQTKDYVEMMEMFDSTYIDAEGNVQKGIEVDADGNYIHDSGSMARKNFSGTLISRQVTWPELVRIFQMSSDISGIENIKNVKLILVADKGIEFSAYYELLDLGLLDVSAMIAKGEYLTALFPVIFPYGLEGFNLSPYQWGNLVKFAFNLGALDDLIPPGTLDDIPLKYQDDIIALAISTAFYAVFSLMNLNLNGLDLFVFDEEFTYVENIDGEYKEVTYDFSTKITSETLNGVPGESLGVNNWDGKEIHAWFKTLAITTDLFNRGDLHQSVAISNGFRNDSDSYFTFSNFLKDELNKYDGIEYEWYAVEEIYGLNLQDGISPINLKEPAQKRWYFYTPEYNPIQTAEGAMSKHTIDTQGEALLYSMYENLDYHSYFDAALEIDGMDSYEYKYVSQLYGTKRYSPEHYVKKINQTIYTKGQKEEITFSEFMFLTYTYKPFLRSVNYERLVWDIADLAI